MDVGMDRRNRGAANFGIKFAFCVLALSQSLVANAAEAAPVTPVTPPRSFDAALGGAIIDHTITVSGREFYQQFAALWRELDTSERYQISVHEQPSARRGTQVWIRFGEQRVFQASLPGNRAKARDLAQQAGEQTYQNVVDAEARHLLFSERDLAPAEI